MTRTILHALTFCLEHIRPAASAVRDLAGNQVVGWLVQWLLSWSQGS